MSRRGLAAVAAGATVAGMLAPVPALGAGATYNVLKCHVNSRAATEAVAEVRGPYSTANRCAGADQRLEVTNFSFATAGQTAFWRFNAPAGTAIVGVNVRANLRRDSHHLAQLVAVNSQGTPSVLANGLDSAEGFVNHSFSGLDHAAFVIHLVCGDGGGCAYTDQAHAYAQNIELVLADRSDPQVTSVSGSLVGGGWLRGSHNLQGQATDVGSGLEWLTGRANGVELGRADTGCGAALGGPYVAVFAPCPVSPGIGVLDAPMNTGGYPFVNGSNTLQICVEDFAGNRPACTTRTVSVDNAPPALAFADTQDPDEPELVAVSVAEAHSGIAEGAIHYRGVGATSWRPLETVVSEDQLQASLESSALLPGDYEFQAEATDVAGNVGETTRRADGSPMVLTFPLRESVDLAAGLEPGGAARQTVRYGVGTQVSGRLLDSGGEPLAGQEIVVEEYFGDGALIDHRTRVVRTDSGGRWSSPIPAGPSREVSASFAGSSRFQGTAEPVGRLSVRSQATFSRSRALVPEGGSVVFAGKVGHFGARIPAGGKLIELQVQESVGRWNTVREAFHTKPSGRYRFGYRFGRFYETDARFKFRVKVAHEQGWPYKAPVRSRSRTVTVLAR